MEHLHFKLVPDGINPILCVFVCIAVALTLAWLGLEIYGKRMRKKDLRTLKEEIEKREREINVEFNLKPGFKKRNGEVKIPFNVLARNIFTDDQYLDFLGYYPEELKRLRKDPTVSSEYGEAEHLAEINAIQRTKEKHFPKEDGKTLPR